MNNNIPKYPDISENLLKSCRENHDFRPILFELYKYVGSLGLSVASISYDSEGTRKIPPVNYAVLIGLLNRCVRLMLSNINLSSSRKYGETTTLIDRCIRESAIQIIWLCNEKNEDGFYRYLADGLKTDLRLKDLIEENIKNRNGEILEIENRILLSINKTIELSRLTIDEIKNAKRLPSFETILNNLDFQEIHYIAYERIGSHPIHGTWSDLIRNYLQYDKDNNFILQDHGVETEDIQFVTIIKIVLLAMNEFLKYVINDPSDAEEIVRLINYSLITVDGFYQKNK